MKKYYIISLIACFTCVGLVSCNKDDAYSPALPGANASVAIIPDVFSVESTVEVKSSGEYLGVKTPVSASEDDGFSITEYASRIDDAIPATKGVEISGEITAGGFVGNFISQYGQFNVMSFLDTVNNTTKLRDNISEGPLNVYYDGGWKWSGTAPTWRTSTPTTFWSYAPVSALGSIGLTSVSGGSAGADTTTVLSFSHTVPTSLTDQKDLLLAYNVETRHFQTDASGNYIKDAAGHFQFVEGEDEKFTVHFKHALSAVKFRLNSTSAGANVHSITLCYLDSDNNIVKNVGVAKYGDCTATGTGEGESSSVSFAWSNLGTYKPLRYTFSDTYSTPASSSTVAGGYTNTGEGVMFMIPQTLSRTITTTEGKTANLKIIVEFSKYGSSQYYSVVKDFKVKRSGADSDITWNAGYYYLYELQIGEFHVPGENIPGLNHIAMDKLMTAGTTGEKVPPTPLKIKGVKTMGLVINSYGLGVDEASKIIVMYGLFGTTNSSGQIVMNDPFSGVSADNVLTKPAEAFDFNFANVSSTAVDNTGGMIYLFGQGGNTTETYSRYYSFARTEGKNKTPAEKTGPYYAAFRIPDNTDALQIMVKSSANDNSCGFAMTPRCFIVLEVKEDPNLPGNWSTINWSEYL